MAKNSLDSVLQYLRRVALTGHGDDAHLLERFARHGDETAFERLVLVHGPMVLGLCRRLLRHEQDAEDVFQATFLTLARKASTIGKKESLASWLYKVAYRVACRSRSRELTNRAAVLDRVAAKNEENELHGVLDEEIAGLAERYRRPIVLCCLQGKTIEQAARLLDCPAGTVAGRLARAKEQLRRRLARRGWTLSAAALTTFLTDKALAVALPAGLVASTLAYVSGKSANTGALAAKVFALSDGVLRMMWFNKMKVAAGVVLAVALASTGTGLVVHDIWAGAQAGNGQIAKEQRESGKKASPLGEAPDGTKAEIAGLRKEVAKLREEIRRLSEMLATANAKAEALPRENEPENSIVALFDGIPSDLRSRVQGNSVKGDRLNDWLKANVNGKEKRVKFPVPLRKVRAVRDKDGSYVVDLELGNVSVRALGDTWGVLSSLSSEDDVGNDFQFKKVNVADAEKLVDAKQVTVEGKVKEAAAVSGKIDWQPPYFISLILSDVRIDGKSITPLRGAAQQK